MYFGGILAGGTGSRMETATMPKQFLRVCGVPVFIRTLRTFLSVDKFDYVVVSVNTDWFDKYVELMNEFEIDRNKVVLTPGGDTRFKSLVNIVSKAKEIANDEDSYIVTHDCARLFVSKDIIEGNLESVEQNDMVTTSIPVIDTILQSDDGKSSSVVPDRSKLWADQGPQTFEVNKFMDYYSNIPADEIDSYIEAGKLYLANNCKIGIVKGNRFNFKITNDIDIQYAEFLIERGLV